MPIHCVRSLLSIQMLLGLQQLLLLSQWLSPFRSVVTTGDTAAHAADVCVDHRKSRLYGKTCFVPEERVHLKHAVQMKFWPSNWFHSNLVQMVLIQPYLRIFFFRNIISSVCVRTRRLTFSPGFHPDNMGSTPYQLILRFWLENE